MKVLFVTPWYPSKDNPVSGNFVREMAKSVSNYVEVAVFHPKGCSKVGKSKIINFSVENNRKLKIFRVYFWRSKVPMFSTLLFLFSMFTGLLKTVKVFQPNLIHAHVYFAGFVSIIVGRIAGIPVIVTEHAEILDYYKEYKFRRLRDLLKIKIAELTFNNAALLAPVSKSLQRHVESFGIVKNFVVIPNVINVDFFRCIKNEANHDSANKKVIIFIGGLIPRKGIPYLLEAIKILSSKRADFCLKIVGDGPFRSEYQEMSKKLGITNLVEFVGRVSDEEKLKLLCNSHFLVLPSLYETFGVVLIEAMACGKPVITTDSGGQKEVVNKKTGLVVPVRNSRALASAMEYMLDNLHLYQSHKISKYARMKYNYLSVGKLLHSIYENLIN